MKRHNLITAAVILALSSAVFGCSSGPDSAVIARVNRSTITAADFKRQMEDLAPQMQQAVASDPKARKDFLEDLISLELVLQEARRQGLDRDADFKKRQDAVRKEMERRFQEDTKNELLNRLLKKELADKLSKLQPPTDQEVREYYLKNQDKMRSADGKKLALKDVQTQLKRVILNERTGALYLAYAKELKAKAKITVDDKVLDATATSLSQSSLPGGLELQTPPAAKTDAKKP
jgi:peptidyl-prolyl cis-trans isomerase C